MIYFVRWKLDFIGALFKITIFNDADLIEFSHG